MKKPAKAGFFMGQTKREWQTQRLPSFVKQRLA
jgi:hypothetical protein